MRKVQFFSCILGLLLAATAFAQDKYAITFRGICSQTNAAGKIVSTPANERTLLSDIAAAAGVSSTAGWALAYHVNANGLGDTIEVIDAATGNPLKTVMGLYFGEAFERRAITNAVGSVRRLDYVYTDQNDHAFGSALVSKDNLRNRKTGEVTTRISGDFQYIVVPENGQTGKIYTGTFISRKKLAFP